MTNGKPMSSENPGFALKAAIYHEDDSIKPNYKMGVFKCKKTGRIRLENFMNRIKNYRLGTIKKIEFRSQETDELLGVFQDNHFTLKKF